VLVIYLDGFPVRRQPPIHTVTNDNVRPDVEPIYYWIINHIGLRVYSEKQKQDRGNCFLVL